MRLQRALSRFPVCKSAVFYNGRLRRFVRNARTKSNAMHDQTPAVLNRFVAALPAAPLAPAKGDDAVDGDGGGLLIAQPAALPRVEPGPAAGADAILHAHYC